ncbi:MAG: hypothetical protein ACR2IE_18820 [Candidatus Sumerlaeaceae bacterium]
MRTLWQLATLIGLGTTISVGAATAAVEGVETRAARVGEATYFRVRVPMPADAATGQSFQAFSRRAVAPKFPLLVSNPAFAAPCYMEADQRNHWEPIQSSDVFYGKTSLPGPLKLRLIYPKKEGGWSSADVSVDLKSAEPMTPRTVAGEAGTSTSELSVEQQFARAQATHFEIMNRVVPDDAGFFSYARLHTLRAAKLPTEDLREQQGWDRGARPRDRLYDTATGARAIQETLQMDRMLRSDAGASEARSIDISAVEGVKTKSHPFTEMLKDKDPKFSEIAKLVPADQYMLRFTSTAKLQELADFAQTWGHSLLESPEVGGADAGLRARVQKQICLPSTLLSRVLGPAIIKELAVTGSDPFFREGTDITVIFDTVSPQLFKAAVDTYWKAAVAENPSADTKGEMIAGANVEKIVSQNRTVSAYRAVLGNRVLYSNSRAGLQRVLETAAKPEGSLASAEDFQYLRAVWPQDEQLEDGFLYLSDAFIRKLVGPATKIKEKRRLEAYGSMRMVLNAAMLHGYLNGPGKTPSLEQLKSAGLLQDKDLALNEGKSAWLPETGTIESSVHGTPAFMTPLCELPIDKITKQEQDEYVRFRDRYQEYWRRYFDPIGVRIKVGQTISLDAYILPLIEETHYQNLKRLTGDKPGKFDLSRISTGTLMRWQARLDMEAREVRDARQMVGSMFGRDSAMTDWIGKWFAVWLDDGPAANHLLDDIFEHEFRDAEERESGSRESLASFLEVPVALGVDVKNRFSLAAFLVALQGMVKAAAPDLVRFVPQDPYKGQTFVKVSPGESGPLGRELQRDARRANEAGSADPATTAPDLGLFYGTIGDAFYLTTKKFVLEHLTDALDTQTSATGREIEYNALLTASPANAKQARPLVEKALGQATRAMERTRLRQAWLLYRCGLATSADDVTSAAQTWLGGEILLPSGGKISYDAANDEPISSVYGPVRSMKKTANMQSNPLLQLFDSIAHVRAWLSFTEDGLMTHVELERK